MNHSSTPAFFSAGATEGAHLQSLPAACTTQSPLSCSSSTRPVVAGVQLAAAGSVGSSGSCHLHHQDCPLSQQGEAMVVGVAPGAHSPVLSLTEEEMMEEDHEIVVASSSPILRHHHCRRHQQLRFAQDEPCAQYSLRTSPSDHDRLQAPMQQQQQHQTGVAALSSSTSSSSIGNNGTHHLPDMQVFPTRSGGGVGNSSSGGGGGGGYSGNTPDHLSPVQQQQQPIGGGCGGGRGVSPVAGRFSPQFSRSNSSSPGGLSAPTVGEGGSSYRSSSSSSVMQSLPSGGRTLLPHSTAPMSSPHTMGGALDTTTTTIGRGMGGGSRVVSNVHEQQPTLSLSRSDVDLISRTQEGGGGVALQQPSPVAATTASQPSYKPIYNHLDSDGISVSLEGRELWDEFYKRGTEMIVNRAGRRMFPGFAVNVSGLKPKCKYTMRMEIVLADKHRFKFLNCQWIPIGTSDPQPPCTVYTHPDCPNSGGYWMRQGVSFRKVKITNNKENPKSNVLLHSMHKYYVRLVIEEHKKGSSSSASPPKTVLVQDFPETTFITVTAYQNEEVTQLKISNNPFAKAFREGAGQYDWETLQLIYGPQAHFRGSEHSPITIGNCPSITSPVLPSMSAVPPQGLPHLPSPAWCATPHPMTGHHHHYSGGYSNVQISPSYSPYQPHPTTFDWPPHSNGPILSPRASNNPPPIHPSTGSIFIPDQQGKMAASVFPALQQQQQQQQQQQNSTVISHQNTIPDSWKTNTP